MDGGVGCEDRESSSADIVYTERIHGAFNQRLYPLFWIQAHNEHNDQLSTVLNNASNIKDRNNFHLHHHDNFAFYLDFQCTKPFHWWNSWSEKAFVDMNAMPRHCVQHIWDFRISTIQKPANPMSISANTAKCVFKRARNSMYIIEKLIATTRINVLKAS